MEELSKQERLDKIFMDFAFGLASLSHCVRVQVGVVITVDERVVSTGYNGTPAGYINCDTHFAKQISKLEAQYVKGMDVKPEQIRDLAIGDDAFRKEHGEWSKHEVHGEMNALLHAAKNGVSVLGGTLYTTISPCMDCAKAVIVAGIKKVIYAQEYDRDNYPLTYLKDNGVKVEKWNSDVIRKHTSLS
jgi:dCMP deaminase